MSLTLTTHFYDIFFNQQNILLPLYRHLNLNPSHAAQRNDVFDKQQGIWVYMWRAALWTNTAVLLLHLSRFSFCFHALSLKAKDRSFSLWIRPLANLYAMKGMSIISIHWCIHFIITFKTKKPVVTQGFAVARSIFFSILKYLTSLRKDVFFQNGINTLIHHCVPLLFFMINYSLNLNRW